MSEFSQFLTTNYRPVATVHNQHSASGDFQFGNNFWMGAKLLAAPSLTAGVLATVLSVSGRGMLNFAGAATNNATNRTLRLKITIDGRVIFDRTTGTLSAQSRGIIGVGTASAPDANANMHCVFQPIPFQTSCLIEVASSLTESSPFSCPVNYEVYV